jgi:uncharacterized protein (TIRG00374 family)
MNRRRELILLSCGLGLFALLCWRFGLSELANALAHVQPGIFAAYLVIAAAVLLGYSLRWLAVARALGARSTLAEFWAARVAADAVGGLVPGAKVGGDPLRIALVATNGTSGTVAAAGVAVDRLLELIGNTITTIVCIGIYVLAGAGGSSRSAFLVLAVMTALLVGLVPALLKLKRGLRPVSRKLPARFLERSERGARWLRLVRETEDHMAAFFQGHPTVFVLGLLWTLVIEAVIVAEYYLLLAAFGVHMPLPTLLVSVVATGLARIIPTHAGLGAMEGAQVALFAMTAGKPELGFIVGMLIRLHEVLWTGIGLAALMPRWLTMQRLSRTTA